MDEQSKRLKESTEVQEVDYLGTSEMRKQGQFGYSDNHPATHFSSKSQER